MTETQKRLAKLQIEQSEVRQKLNDLLSKDDRSADESAELESLTKRAQAIEPELRAALVLASDDDGETKPNGGDTLDAETRERLELRGRCSVSRYVEAALRGRLVNGAEAEYMQAEGVDGIPLALFDEPESREVRADAVTGTPATTGVNLQPIRPAIFAASIAGRLGIDMPRVASGTYAEARIDTSLTAEAKAKGGAAESTAVTFTVSTATPKRVSGRLGIQIEDIASIGASNFESALRQNLMLVMSDELDDQIINGDGQAPNLSGLFKALTDADAPADVATFDAFAAAVADGIEGLWAATTKDVAIVVGPDTYKLSAKTFQASDTYKGELSAARYLRQESAGWWTNKRMPDAAANVQKAIMHRAGRTGIRTAVCPHWGALSVDDVYSGSASGTRYVTFHVLLGDVLVIQPGAYSEVAFKLAA